MSVLDEVPRTSVNQAPWGGTDYPFAGPGDLCGAVLDFYLSHPAGPVLPLTLTVSGTGFEVTDAGGTVVAFGDTTGGTNRAWGDRTVYEWVNDPWVMRVVVRPDHLADGAGVLDPRTFNALPARVTTLRVGTVRVGGAVRFEAGYNIDLAGAVPAQADGRRFVSQVNMDAVPGAGAGRYPGCDDADPVVRTINGVGPDCSGDFKLVFDACFKPQLPLLVTGASGGERTAEYSADGLTTEEAAAATRVTNDCRPCCECDYFVRTYRGLKRVWGKWQAIGSNAEAVRDTYADNRARWLASRECRMAHPARLAVTTADAGKVAVGGSFCNFTKCCVAPVELRFTFQLYDAGAEVPWGTGTPLVAYLGGSPTEGEERYVPMTAGDGQVVRFFLDYADPQAASVAKMRFCVTGATDTQTVKVTMTAHVPTPGPDPYTGDTCETPVIPVPGAVTGIWLGAGVPAGPDVRAVVEKYAALTPDTPVTPTTC